MPRIRPGSGAVVWAPDWQPARARRAADPGAPVLAAVAGSSSVLQVMRRLETSPRGLTEAQAEQRREMFGENVVAASPAGRRWGRLGPALRNPFVLILIALAAVSAVTRDGGGAVVIAVLAAASITLRVGQERRSDRAAAALRAMVPATVAVTRKSAPGSRPVDRHVPVCELVPGDVVRLEAGDVVPADLLVLRSDDLAVSEAVLTGESAPARKQGMGTMLADGSADLCYMGTSVVSGSCSAVVVATGRATYLGSAYPDGQRTSGTCFDRGVRGIAWLLIALMVVCVPAVLAINASVRGHLLEAFLFAVAVAVGLTPEMLPVVVTAALARGAARVAGQGVITRRLPALHDVGAMDVLCTDKTGTLTEGELAVDCAIDPAGSPDAQVLLLACQNSLHATLACGQPVASLLDLALLEQARGTELPADDGREPVGVIPFDSTRRRATVVLDGGGPDAGIGTHELIMKGSPAEVLRCCDLVRSGDRQVPLTPAGRARADQLSCELAGQGIRLLAVATDTRPARLGRYTAADETGLTLVGFVGFTDRPLASARSALSVLAGAGVTVKVVTGDDPIIAARACRDAGIDPGDPVTGEQVSVLDEAGLAALAGRTTVFARTDQAQKARIVAALRSAGHTVGYLGDGVNDISALRSADVGITVSSAVPVARECADLILLGKDLALIGQAVTEGRRTFANVAKYLKITVSSNVGNVLSMMLASAVLPFLPMLPLQVLVQNMCSDASQIALAFDTVDPEQLRRPRSFDVRDLARFAAWLGPVNALADVATFVILWHLIGGHASVAGQMLFRAGWFAENLVTQAAAVHLLRRDGRLMAGRIAARPVVLATCGLALVGLCLPFTPVAPLLHLGGLPASYFPLLAVVLAGYCLASVAAKAAYLRRRSA
jgi:Mg2+-importing ATPase